MPILPDDDPVPVTGLAPQLAEPLEINAPSAPFGRVLDTFMRRENLVGSAANRLAQPEMSPFDPSFDPFGPEGEKVKGYEDNLRAFIGASSEDDLLRIKARIDAERRDTDIVNNSGFAGIAAGLAAGVLDPTTIIPVGGQISAVARTGRALEGALRFGAATAGGAAVQEAGLQATQDTRSLGESLLNVGGATIIGGALGGAVGALSRRFTSEFADDAMREMGIYQRQIDRIFGGAAQPIENAAEALPEGALSAAATRGTTLAQETQESALGMERLLSGTGPTPRMMSSPLVTTRQRVQELAEVPTTTRGQAEGIAAPIAAETIIRQADLPLADSLAGFDDLFVRYRLERDRRPLDVTGIAVSDLVRDRGGKLSYDKFAEAVGHAMRNDDQHEIPAVAEAAKLFRQKVFDPWKQRAIAAGLLDEDVGVDTALSYLSRVYNTEKIARQRDKFSEIITRWLADEQSKKDVIRGKVETLLSEQEQLARKVDALDQNQPRIDEIQIEIEKLVGSWEGNTSRSAKSAVKRRTEKEATREPGAARLREADSAVLEAARAIAKANTRLMEEDLKDISRQIIDRILGSPVGRLPYDIETPGAPFRTQDGPAPRGPLAARAFKIPDVMIEDFLESDIRLISRMYSRTMAPDVVLTEKFGRADMEDQIKEIQQGYEALRTKAAESKTGPAREKALKDLDDAMRRDIRDMAAVRDRLRRTYGMPENPNGLANRAFHVVRDLNYLRLLGGMTLSALPDVGRSVMVHGVNRVVGDALVPMLTNWKQFKLAMGEARLAGNALDMVLDTRSMAMADMMDDYGRWSKYERGVQAMAGKFGLVTLMAPWNAAMKQFAGVVSQTRTLRAVERIAAGRPVKQSEIRRLAHLGIGQAEAERIAAQFKAHGSKNDNVWWANTEAWDDRIAADHFRAALSKEINMMIVTPGQEIPLVMSGAWGATGKLLFQFKGFGVASTQRVLMTGLQRRDMATLSGVIMMSALGMLAYRIRYELDANPNKKELPDASTASGLAQWLREGVDRSGLTGWMFDAHNTLEKVTGGSVGLQRLIGDAPTSRYGSRSALETLLGPTGGLVESAARVAGTAATGELTEGNVSEMRRWIPTQNHIAFRKLWDQAEQGLHETLGTR